MASLGSYYGIEDYSDKLYSWKESVDFDAVSQIAVYTRSRIGVTHDFTSDTTAVIYFDTDAVIILVAVMEADASIAFYARAPLVGEFVLESSVNIPFDAYSDEFFGYPWVPEIIPPPGEIWIPVPPPVEGWAPIISAEGPWMPIQPSGSWSAVTGNPGPWIPVGPDRRPNSG